MIKTKFVFAVSLVAMLAVSSAWANVPGNDEDVGDVHTVYTDQSPTSTDVVGGTAIAGVTYVNRAVNKAGASATAAERHAAAAGKSALAAAESAAQAASSANKANTALAGKQDKLGFTPENVANRIDDIPEALNDITDGQYPSAKAVFQYVSGQIGSVSATNNTLKGEVDTLKSTTAALDAEKQDKLTAGVNITIAEDGTISAKDTVYTLPAATSSVLGGVKVDTALSSTSTNPVQNKVINTELGKKQAKLTATGGANRPVYAVAGGVAAVTGVSIPVGAAETTSTAETAWASIWVE